MENQMMMQKQMKNTDTQLYKHMSFGPEKDSTAGKQEVHQPKNDPEYEAMIMQRDSQAYFERQ